MGLWHVLTVTKSVKGLRDNEGVCGGKTLLYIAWGGVRHEEFWKKLRWTCFSKKLLSRVWWWKSQMKGNMICQNINKKTHPLEEASLQCACCFHLEENARETLNIHDWHIFFVLPVSRNQSTQLVEKPPLLHVSSHDLKQQIRHGGLNPSYWLRFSFQGVA